MLQSNTLFGFYNQTETVTRHRNSANLLWSIVSGGNKIFVASPAWSKFDKLNTHASFYNLIKENPRGVTVTFFRNCFFAQWAHIGFRGKSFRIRNFCAKNKFTLNFGYSHWTKLKLLENWAFFKRRRQNYVIFTWYHKDFTYFTRFFPHIRMYNRYTMRGLRLRKQPIIRRFGKISQHISSLH